MGMMMSKAASLPDILVFEPQVYRDQRGYFFELYNEKTLGAEIGTGVRFVQDNVSYSERGTLRGLHYQKNPQAQGKLVQVLQGAAYDACVDIRQGSPTFGKWYGCVLSSENHRMLYIPPGYAHGFLALNGPVVFSYKCTDFYAPELERSIIWNDPEIGIRWPETPDFNLMSEKDKKAPALGKADLNFVFLPGAISAQK